MDINCTEALGIRLIEGDTTKEEFLLLTYWLVGELKTVEWSDRKLLPELAEYIYRSECIDSINKAHTLVEKLSLIMGYCTYEQQERILLWMRD